MAEARIQTQCEGCGATVLFPASELGTVQECPECQGWLDVPEVTRVPTVFDQQTEAYDQQMEESARQQQVYADQLERAQRQIDRRDQLDAMEEEMLKRADRLLDRWESLAVRLERTLPRPDSQDSD